MTEPTQKLIEIREDLLNAIANVQMKLISVNVPTTELCGVCDGSCRVCKSCRVPESD